MAAIGKIRSWGPWLVGIIALALFGFIATDLTKSCETTSNQKRQRVGEVLGKKLNYSEYDAMINQYEEVLKFLGYDVKDDARTELSDHVWQMYLENELISDECKKLGLEVTDAELASVFQNGTDPVLYQTRLMRNIQQPIILQQFFNQQTGRFDYSYVTMTKENLRQQAEKGNREAIEMYPKFNNYWSLVEKLVRQQLLTNKYQNLLKGINLIAKFPALSIYAYYTKVHTFDRSSLIIHYPTPDHSMAENILYMLRPDGQFTDREANLLDALAAVATSHVRGIDSRIIARALSSFVGAHRRCELTSITDGVKCFTDYGHNPAEIQNAIKIVSLEPHNTLWSVWQPHTYSRTKTLFNAFLESFYEVDKLLITDICASREVDPGDISSDMLIEPLRARGVDVVLTPSFDDTENYLRSHWHAGDIMLSHGCGDIYLLNEQIARHGDTNTED